MLGNTDSQKLRRKGESKEENRKPRKKAVEHTEEGEEKTWGGGLGFAHQKTTINSAGEALPDRKRLIGLSVMKGNLSCFLASLSLSW